MNLEELYSFYNIKPNIVLSSCQFFNEMNFRMEFGDDVCEAVDDDSVSCENCPKSILSVPYYPPITDELIINMLLVCGISDLGIKEYSTEKDQDFILTYVINKSKHDLMIKSSIEKMLKNHLNRG